MALKFSLARVGACALALLAMSTVSPVSASAQAPPYFMQWGSPSGSGNGMLYGPRGVALDASGDVYIADCDNNRIQKFTASGTYIMQWGSEGGGNGQFNFPCAIAVDTSGDIYIADGNNHRIQKFTSDGTYITQWGVAFPYGVTVDKDGNVYVVDLGSHRVQKFTNGGALLTQWGSFGSGNGQFEWPLGVAVDASGDVYVTDESDRVQKFTGDGTYIIGWGAPGAGNGQLGLPYGVALDASGNVYVAEYDNNRIQKFTGNGGYLTQWGGLGSGNGQFSAPSGVAVDAGSDVYVADIRNSRIQVFSYGPYITGITDVPNDQGGSVRVTWAAGLPESGGRAGIDAYRVRRRESGSWVSVGSVLRSGSPTYSCVVPTTSDYTVGAPLPWNVFRIDAEAPDTGYVSPPDRGYSIDDLAPAPPTGFVGTFASGVATMHWHAAPEPDFSFYALYRGPTPGFVPTPARLVATTSDTTATLCQQFTIL